MLVEMHHGWLVMSGPDPFFRSPGTDADWDALNRAWKELVLGDPGAYLQFHGDQFARLIHMTDDDLPGAVWNRFLEDDAQLAWIDHDASFSWVQERGGLGVLYWLDRHTPLFRPYVYLFAALLLLGLCRSGLPAALYLSGLLYELSFFPVGAEPEYRYSHWMVVASTIATVVLFIQRRQARR
jgi:hypothetical protein